MGAVTLLVHEFSRYLRFWSPPRSGRSRRDTSIFPKFAKKRKHNPKTTPKLRKNKEKTRTPLGEPLSIFFFDFWHPRWAEVGLYLKPGPRARAGAAVPGAFPAGGASALPRVKSPGIPLWLCDQCDVARTNFSWFRGWRNRRPTYARAGEAATKFYFS